LLTLVNSDLLVAKLAWNGVSFDYMKYVQFDVVFCNLFRVCCQIIDKDFSCKILSWYNVLSYFVLEGECCWYGTHDLSPSSRWDV